LRAVAGAGKTTTLIQALKLMDGQVFFGAYNKKIAEEIKLKAGQAKVDRPGIYISTMHAAGFRTWMQVYKNSRVDDKKVMQLVDAMVRTQRLKASECQVASLADQYRRLADQINDSMTFITKMVSFGKQYLIGITSDLHADRPWMTLVEHFSADEELPGGVEELPGGVEELPGGVEVLTALTWVREIYQQSIDRCKEVIDFDDMIFAPLFFNCRFFKYDWVLGDEWQDTNPARLEMACRMLKDNGRFLGVGDERQAIYGFAGAGADSLAKTIERLNCKILPLTVTYRCAQDIVAYAHQWVDHIQAHPSAPKGVVRPAKIDPAVKTPDNKVVPWFLQDAPSVDDAVLCRFTKPLIVTAYGMLRAGVAAKVEGRDLGLGLCKLAQRWKISRIDSLDAKLDEYLANEVRKAQIAKNTKREDEVIDRVATLRIFMDRCREQKLNDIPSLVREINSLFADNVTGAVVLSTGHKAKGREWPRVFWIQHTDRPGRGTDDWRTVEESNIKYVITTRAISELVLVPEIKKDS
jgi:superfamily I DNA/RNA helicase